MPSDGALVPLDTAAASDADVSIATDGCVELIGLSAAMGKLGAIGGSYVFGAIITCAPDPNGAISLILGLVTAAELMGAVLTVVGVGVSRPPFMARVDEGE